MFSIQKKQKTNQFLCEKCPLLLFHGNFERTLHVRTVDRTDCTVTQKHLNTLNNINPEYREGYSH